MPADLTPAERSLRARLAAHASWAATGDPTERTAPGRAAGPGQLAYWERKVDPDGAMEATERARRAESLRKAHYTRLALRSAKARRRRKAEADLPEAS